MGACGRQYYESNYSKPKLMARLEKLFHDATLRKEHR